ncbi:MAG: hypothetical protein R3A80_13130 [Bdellovibrionota bacterium]
MRLFACLIVAGFGVLPVLHAKCFKVVGHVINSTQEYVDVRYRESSLRLHYKVVARRTLLPRGVSLQAYFEKSSDSKYLTEYSAIDIPRRSVASSDESFTAAKLTKDGKCLKEFK